MDRLTAFVAIAHLRLRLDLAQRHPHLLEGPFDMTPKLQGIASAMGRLQHDLEVRSGKLLDRIQAAETRGSAAFAKAHKSLDATEGAMAEVETFIASLEGSNGGPISDGSSGSSAAVSGQATIQPPAPEQLTTNGVSVG